MKSFRFIIFLFIIMASLGLASCAREGVELSIRPGMPNWEAAKEYSYAYERARSRRDRLALAQKGIGYGEACINETPKNPACYYYRAINTGLYYKSKVVGYQKGLKTMVADCHKIISLDPSYEHGGGYRLLGEIYTEVPAFSLKPDYIVRDLDQAIMYLKRAISHGSEYPENYIAISKAYLKAGDKDEAALTIVIAKELLPGWRHHDDYATWKREIRKESKKLKRHIKNLQLTKRTTTG